ASTSIQVTVANVVDDFALSLSPSSQALPAGGSVAFDVISTVAAGNAEPISLSVSGLPQGVQMNVQPSTLAAGNTAILTLSASANTAARAAATFTVLGTSPSQPAGHTATATVSVTAARSDGGSGGGPGGTSSSSSGCSTTGGAAPPEGLLVLLGAALGLRARARPKVPEVFPIDAPKVPKVFGPAEGAGPKVPKVSRSKLPVEDARSKVPVEGARGFSQSKVPEVFPIDAA
ncbi:MAG TPA: hypothetical protein VK454_10935, partial [Myxococcaceae bacterium]|nr:hypothetical protein [Myxococcaceae bacterium]